MTALIVCVYAFNRNKHAKLYLPGTFQTSDIELLSSKFNIHLTALVYYDTWSVVNEDGSNKTKVYHKETHADQYLHFSSNHPFEHKRGVVKTPMHRVDTIMSIGRDKVCVCVCVCVYDYSKRMVQSTGYLNIL